MASSSLASDAFGIIALLVISLIVLLLLRYYLPLRSTPSYLLLPVFLALALPSSIILLVPIDLASAAATHREGTRGIWLPQDVLLVTWRIAYWLTFALTWLVLPLLGEFTDSGYRDTRRRVLYSLRSNARYQLIVLGSAVAGLVYFIWQNGLHTASIKGLVMALAYAWGLILAICLMGHGLVALPRALFRNASVSARLRMLETQAPKTRDRLDDAMEQLEQLESQLMSLRQRKNGISGDMQEWIAELADTSALPESNPSTAPSRASGAGVPAVVTERYLADLSRKLKRARHRRARFVDEWERLIQRAKHTHSIIDAAASHKLVFIREYPSARITILTPTSRYYLHAKVTPALRYLLGAVLALASLAVIWSELLNPLNPKLSLVGLSTIHHPSSSRGQINFGGQLTAAAWLSYMCSSALYAISDVRVWGNRALVKRHTYGESACWYSLQVAKLTVPLAYNFLTLTPGRVYRHTVFYRLLGSLVDLTPLGTAFSAYFPCFILLPVLATLFNLYGKVRNVFGFGVVEDGDEEGSAGGGWQEGRELMEREMLGEASGASALGLANRGASLDEPRSVAGTARAAGPARLLPSTAPRMRNAAADRLRRGDEREPGFFDDFSERVRNTFGTAERPEWVKSLGEGVRRSRWMRDEGGGGGGGSGIGRWFGGGGGRGSGGGDGRVRL